MSTDTHTGRGTPSPPAIDVRSLALAELHAGQPKAAHRWLTATHQDPTSPTRPTDHDLLRHWACRLDTNTYPGDITSDLTLTGTLPPATHLTPTTAKLVELAVTFGIPRAPHHQRHPAPADSRTSTALTAHAAIGHLQRLVYHGVRSDEPTIALWAHLAQAEVAHRSGMTSLADTALQTTMKEAERLHTPVLLALAHSKEGDWLASPGIPPECLGSAHRAVVFSPRPRSCDLRTAAAKYRQAEDVLRHDDAPGPRAALALRHAHLAWVIHDFDAQRHHLQLAHDHAVRARATAYLKLVQLHQRLNEIATTCHTTEQPDATSNDLQAWAISDGSTSWTQGLAHVAETAARHWAQQNRPQASATAHDLANALTTRPANHSGAGPIKSTRHPHHTTAQTETGVAL